MGSDPTGLRAPADTVVLQRLDLSAADDWTLAARLDAALAGPGCFTIVGHEVPPAVVEAAFDASRRFFALPERLKSQWHLGRSSAERGFDPIGWQALDAAGPHDLKECFRFGVEHAPDHPLVLRGVAGAGANQWPDDDVVPGFRAACEAYAQAMDGLSRRLLRLCALGLGLTPTAFDACMRDPLRSTRLLHYPPQPRSALLGQIGCGAHTDWGALTLLAQDDAGGLQVQMPDGAWVAIAPEPAAFVVHAGDLLQRWTNDRWRSPPHRVINGRAGADRWSIAHALDLDHDAHIEPLPHCVGPHRPARYAPITVGAHLAERHRRALPQLW